MSRPPASTPNDAPHAVRLQKLLAEAGYGSRRACEALITSGRVAVDGKPVTTLGVRADPDSQKITVDRERVRAERKVYYLVHKPPGVVSSNADPEGRPRVVDLLPRVPQRVYTVGRLDMHSEGLVLLTNDGELAQRLTHPRYGVEKTYLAQVQGVPSPATLRRVEAGVWSSAGKLRAQRIRFRRRFSKGAELEITLREGKNRQVRRMLASVGHRVLRLKRTAIDRLKLARLAPGASRRLTAAEVKHLRGKFLPAKES